MKPKRKVLFVIPYFPPHIGGAENYAYNIASGLHLSNAWEVVIVTSNNIDKKIRVEVKNGLKIYRLPILFTLSNTPINPFWIFDIKKIIHAEKPDIINAHSPVPFMPDIAAFSSGKIPFVLTYHSGPMALKDDFIKDSLIRIYEKFFLRFMVSKAHKIVSSSNYVKHALFQNVKGKVITITPGVETARFKPGGALENSLLFVGNLNAIERYKGLETLLNALKRVLKSFPNIGLTVVGKGDYLSDYKRKVRELNIEKNVLFTGELHGQNIIKKYQSAIVLVHPSNFDSFPLVILEAMACGIPVIASRVGGIPEMVKNEKNGLLIPPKNEEKLAKAITKIINDKKSAKKMGQVGFTLIKQNYDWNLKVAATSKLFMEVTNITV